MNNDPNNYKNTLTYENVGGSGLRYKKDNEKLTYFDPNTKRSKTSPVLMLIFEILLTAAAGTLCIIDGIWPIISYFFLSACMVTTYFSSVDRSLRYMIMTVIFELLICGGIFASRILYPAAFEKIPKLFIHCASSGLIMTIGAGLIIYSVVSTRSCKRICTVPIQGRVISIKETKQSTGRGHSVIVYCPEYEYYYNGQIFRSFDYKYHKYVNPLIDEIRTIYIDPEYPMFFIEPKRTAALNRRKMFFGISFLLIGAMLMYLWIH